MATLLARRRERLAAGERPIGWKVGFGAKAAMEKLGIDAPLVGFLTDAGLVTSESTVSLAGWTKPVAEPEVAVYIGKDIPGGASDDVVKAAISGLAPAIELADLDPPPAEIEAILGGNVYNRHIILGQLDPSRAGGSVEGLRTRLVRNGKMVAIESHLEANTGRILTIVRQVADTLARCGERLRDGEFIIAGSIVPPIFLEAEDRTLVHEVEGLATVSVRFTHA
jgi:2-keto-4-pentenoate hydratase